MLIQLKKKEGAILVLGSAQEIVKNLNQPGTGKKYYIISHKKYGFIPWAAHFYACSMMHLWNENVRVIKHILTQKELSFLHGLQSGNKLPMLCKSTDANCGRLS